MTSKAVAAVDRTGAGGDHQCPAWVLLQQAGRERGGSIADRIRCESRDAILLDRQGKYEEAMGHYWEALRLNPQDAQSHNNIGVTLAEQGKLEEGIKHFSEALRINPSFTEAQRNLENGLRLVGKATTKSPGASGQ